MNFIQSIILGLVEGVTEFLPISSTFHLIFTSKLLGIQETDFTKLFEVFIQSGAILSVVLLYFNEIMKDQELIKKTLASFLPTAVIGLVLYKVIKNVFFDSPILMLAVFIVMGAAFIAFEYFIKKDRLNLKKEVASLNYKEAIIIGLIQALAVIPGVSRAGAVLLGMMLLGYKRDEAAKFSFILAIPTLLAASTLDLYKGRDLLFHQGSNITLLLIGTVSAFVSSYFVVKWFIGFLQKNSLASFGIYRLILGFMLLLFGMS